MLFLKVGIFHPMEMEINPIFNRRSLVRDVLPTALLLYESMTDKIS